MPGAEKIIIYCDGACSGNQYKTNTGGWGAILKHKDRVKEVYGGERNTTNQRMELIACIKALEMVKTKGRSIEVYTDSSYLFNAITRKWYLNWQRNGWRNYSRKPVENRDLWERLLSLLSLHKVSFKKVAGHTGDELNERADELARQGITELRKTLQN
jgi:ribonuclease HI